MESTALTSKRPLAFPVRALDSTVDEAICLKTYPYSETSKIAVYWSRSYGELRAVIKGVRRAGSRLAVACESLTQLQLTLSPGRGESGLATIYQAESRYGFVRLRSRLLSISAATMLAEWLLCNRLDPHPAQLFDWISHALRQLDHPDHHSTHAVAQVVMQAEQAFAELTGHALQLNDCMVCQRPLPAGDLVYFAVAWGGAVCEACHRRRDEPEIRFVRLSSTTRAGLLQADQLYTRGSTGSPEHHCPADTLMGIQKFWHYVARCWWQQPLPAHGFWLEQLAMAFDEAVSR